jgi:hypothetical protein
VEESIAVKLKLGSLLKKLAVKLEKEESVKVINKSKLRKYSVEVREKSGFEILSSNYGELTYELRQRLGEVITKPVVVEKGKYQSARIMKESCNLRAIIIIVFHLSTGIKCYSLCRKKRCNSKLPKCFPSRSSSG